MKAKIKGAYDFLNRHKWYIYGATAVLIIVLIATNKWNGGYSHASGILPPQYEIRAGQQNFKPLESPLPKWGKMVTIDAELDSSCFYSWRDWSFDRDWWDWNKLKGVTSFFGANNKTSAMVGWRPANIKGFMLTPYVNDKKGKAHYADGSDAFFIEVNQPFRVTIELQKNKAVYTFTAGDKAKTYTISQWRRPWHGIYREVGTWIGGANNEPGPYGGAATQDMKLLARMKLN